jgi:4-amino-4-deoxy-L-arabinose transferase-like glycosyltransferase
VTDTNAASLSSNSAAARLAWIILILATLYVSYFYNLGVVGFMGPDEPRYAWIARDMAESGDWITPRLYGKPWFEKPPLLYWTAALSFKLFGVSEAAARLPSAVAALLATLAVAWLACRVYGPEVARWLLLLLPTTVGMIGFSHAAATDMLFAGTLIIAMVVSALLVGAVPVTPRSSLTSSTSFTSLLFGVSLGFAVLAKGPAAVVLSGGAVLLWAIFTKRWRDALRCFHPVGITGFSVTSLPWYILCARRNPDFFRVFIIEHNFKRYLTPEFQHIQPFWFYLPVLLIAFLPWTATLVWAAARESRILWKDRRLSAIAVFLMSWACFCFLFFSASQSKLPGYILPAIPPIGLLLAVSCVRLPAQKQRVFRWLHVVLGLIAIASATALFSNWFVRTSIELPRARAAALVLFASGMANVLLANRGSQNNSLRQIAPLCVLPILILVADFRPLARPWLSPDSTAKSIALQLEKLQSFAPSSPNVYVSSMTRAQQYGLSFYLHREVQSWNTQKPTEGLLLVPSSDSRRCVAEMSGSWSCSKSSIQLGTTGWFAWQVQTRKDSSAQ